MEYKILYPGDLKSRRKNSAGDLIFTTYHTNRVDQFADRVDTDAHFVTSVQCKIVGRDNASAGEQTRAARKILATA